MLFRVNTFILHSLAVQVVCVASNDTRASKRCKLHIPGAVMVGRCSQAPNHMASMPEDSELCSLLDTCGLELR